MARTSSNCTASADRLAQLSGSMPFHIRPATQADVPRSLHSMCRPSTKPTAVDATGAPPSPFGLTNVARRFLEQGMSSIVLFGEATSPSNGFYEAFGAERLYAPNGEFHGGYGWRDVETLLALCGTA